MLCTCWKSAALGGAAPALPPRRSSGLCQVSFGRPEGPTLLKRHRTPVQRECRGYTGEPKRPLTSPSRSLAAMVNRLRLSPKPCRKSLQWSSILHEGIAFQF